MRIGRRRQIASCSAYLSTINQVIDQITLSLQKRQLNQINYGVVIFTIKSNLESLID